MLVLPGPPKILPSAPSLKSGEYARPRRGPKLLYFVGASVLGMPASPGNTNPVGESGNTVDCRPGTQAWIFPCVSYHGMLTSQRSPRFSVRLGLTFHESCTNAPPYFVRESNTC